MTYLDDRGAIAGKLASDEIVPACRSWARSSRRATTCASFELGRGEIVGNINFLMRVPVEADGSTTIADGVSGPGKFVDLRAERRRNRGPLQLPPNAQPVQRIQPDADPLRGATTPDSATHPPRED